MSESKTTPGYARMWFVMWNVVVLLILILGIAWTAGNDIADLQRRIGTLEQRCK